MRAWNIRAPDAVSKAYYDVSKVYFLSRLWIQKQKSNSGVNVVTHTSSTYQEDDGWVPNKSNSSAQLSLVATTAHATKNTKHLTTQHLRKTGIVKTQMLHRHPIPVSATAFVGMLAEVQPSDFSFHHLFDLALWNPSEAGKHCQEFTASQTFNQGIKLARSQGTRSNMRLLCPGTQYANFNHSKTLENFSAQKIASISTS